ncbi:MAG: hypothetical protein AB7O91_00895 [Sphingomonas sp.]
MRQIVLLSALFAGAAFAQTTTAPTAAQFQRAMAEACPAPRAAVRNVRCDRAEDGSVQFSCTYEMQGANGQWASHTATLQQAEGQWVWIDGPTRCDGEDTGPN